jgi:NTP pyrophosphatase (non-canonical NTP hydrolase)
MKNPILDFDRMGARRLVAGEVDDERKKQDRTWGPPDMRPDDPWLAILVEEVGEVARAALANPDDRKAGDLYSELIQVAAVAQAWAESLKGGRGG